MLQSPGSKHELGLRARLEIGASDRGRCSVAVGWFVLRRMVWGWFQDLRTLRGCFDAAPLGIQASTKTPSCSDTARHTQQPVTTRMERARKRLSLPESRKNYSAATEFQGRHFVSLWVEGDAEGNGKHSVKWKFDQDRKATSECLSCSPSTTRPRQELLSCQHLATTIHPREDRSCCFPRRQCDPQSAHRRLQVARQEKEGSCESWRSVQCQGATAPQTGRQVGNNLGRCGSSRQVRMGGQQRLCTYLGTLEYEQGQHLTLVKELTLDTAR